LPIDGVELVATLPVMKIQRSILPIAAFVLASVWLVNQRQSISKVEDANAKIQKEIAAVRVLSPGTALAHAEPKVPVKVAAPAGAEISNEPLDWKNIAAQCEVLRQNYDAKKMERLTQRFEKMSPAELVAALEEVATLGLSAGANRLLMARLVDQLVAKDPELALTHHMDFLGDKTFGLGDQLAKVTQSWAEKDPARAAAWFAEQLAAGKLDGKALSGKSDIRSEITQALMSGLLGTNPAATSRFLAAMDEGERVETVGNYLSNGLKEENQLAFATLVRGQLSAQDQATIFSTQVSQIMQTGDYAKVEDFLKRVAATPAERTLCVEEAAAEKIQSISINEKITRADVEDARKWTQTQAPGSTDSITGKIIADTIWCGGKITFAEASELALQYNSASGNDDTLSSFLLNRSAFNNKEAARTLAAKITDPTRRAEILKKLQ
jgi:hypothetical protein